MPDKWFFILAATIFSTAAFGQPQLSAGWFWETGNALGFAALTGFLYLFLLTPGTTSIHHHKQLSYAVGFLCLAHAIWFLVGDSITLEYISPGAPAYMWAGLFATILSIYIIVISLPKFRQANHHTYLKFRQWHRALSIAIVVLVLYHIIAAGFYLRAHWQIALIIALAILITAPSLTRCKLALTPPAFRPASLVSFLSTTLLLSAIFIVFRSHSL